MKDGKDHWNQVDYDVCMTHPRRTEADIALPLLTESGYLERSVRTSGWPALGGSAVLDGSFLTWDPDVPKEERGGRVTSGIGMLDGFRRLAAGTDGAILGYARRWGFLSVCSHGVRDDHASIEVPARLVDPISIVGFEAEDHYNGPHRERLDVWRYWATQADAMLRAMTRLRSGASASNEEWSPLWQRGPWTAVLEAHIDSNTIEKMDAPWLSAPAPPSEGQRWRIAAALETWMKLGGVGLTLGWTGDSAAMGFDSPTLLGSLGLQLALASTGLESWAVCSNCGAPYASGRLPRVDRRNHCPACREAKVPARDASRRYRAKARQEKGPDR
jgi:hypothetical protein